MSKKPCWSWRHRMKFTGMTSKQYSMLYKACSTLGIDCWDITAVRRRGLRLNLQSNVYWYSRVTVHFKQREDLVFFKLSINDELQL